MNSSAVELSPRGHLLRCFSHRGVHWAHQLEVVAVGVRKSRDHHSTVLGRVVGLLDDGRAFPFELRELTLHVGRLEVPNHAARLAVLSFDLAVRSEADPAFAELPTEVRVVFEGRLAEELRVVLLEPVGVLGADENSAEFHGSPPCPRDVFRSLVLREAAVFASSAAQSSGLPTLGAGRARAAASWVFADVVVGTIARRTPRPSHRWRPYLTQRWRRHDCELIGGRHAKVWCTSRPWPT